MDPIEASLDERDDALSAGRRSRRWWWWIMGASVSCVVVALASQSRPLARWVRGETDLQGRRLYAPDHPSSPHTVQKIDLDRVHRVLLPAWVLAASRMQRGVVSVRSERAAFDALIDAIAPDRNLVELAESLRAVVLDGLEDDPERALYLTWAWSRHLDAMKQPWLVHGRVHVSRHGTTFALLVYAVLDEAVISVGVDEHRVRAVRRVDRTNLREAYLGATTRDDPTAIVSMDRLEELATRELWPLLGSTEPSGIARRSALANAVAAETLAAIGHEHFRVLARTAWARASILETIDQVHARRACGSTFRIHAIPRAGFESERIQRLHRHARRSRDRCPSITTTEIDRIADASRALEDAGDDLDRALRALTSWTAELVGVHEARHLADAQRLARLERGPTCFACPAGLGPETRNELSGYLAALAWSGAPATTFYQACRATALDPGGPHVEAMRLIESELGVRCSSPPPPDLTARARALERTLLGRSDPIAVARRFETDRGPTR